jgi:hypothetical protein
VPPSWSVQKLGAGAGSFFGAVAVNGSAYFIPGATNGAAVSPLTIYDTTQRVNANGAYTQVPFPDALVDASLSFAGGAYDGHYVHLANTSLRGAIDAATAVAYDTTVDGAASWSSFDLGFLSPKPQGFLGAVFDGRYVYFVPYNNTVLVRFDAIGQDVPKLPPAASYL